MSQILTWVFPAGEQGREKVVEAAGSWAGAGKLSFITLPPSEKW